MPKSLRKFRWSERVFPDPIRALRREIRAFGEQMILEDVPLTPTLVPYEFTQTNVVEAKFLVGTWSGLYCYDYGRMYRLLDGFTFGITSHKDRWYIFNQHARRKHAGQIISFRLNDLAIEDPRVEVNLLGPHVHQIYAHDDQLFIADTQNERLVRYDIGRCGLKNRNVFYPNGWRLRRRYLTHLNSVYVYNDRIYLIYHNLTTRTGRSSQIAVLNHQFQVEQMIDTRAGDAHNIVFWKDKPVYCDSKSGTLEWGEESVLNLGCYTRGIVLINRLGLVGGSDFVERRLRERAPGYVFAFSPANWQVTSQMTFPKIGSVFELRLVELNEEPAVAGRDEH